MMDNFCYLYIRKKQKLNDYQLQQTSGRVVLFFVSYQVNETGNEEKLLWHFKLPLNHFTKQ